MKKSKPTASKDQSYAAVLLEAANSHQKYTITSYLPCGRITQREVSASIVQRLNDETPLSEMESKFFDFIRSNPHIINAALIRIEQLIQRGYESYSLPHLVGSLRVDADLDVNQTDDHKINDHISASFGRYLNELLNAPFFAVRHAMGEPRRDDLLGIAAA